MAGGNSCGERNGPRVGGALPVELFIHVASSETPEGPRFLVVGGTGVTDTTRSSRTPASPAGRLAPARAPCWPLVPTSAWCISSGLPTLGHLEAMPLLRGCCRQLRSRLRRKSGWGWPVLPAFTVLATHCYHRSLFHSLKLYSLALWGDAFRCKWPGQLHGRLSLKRFSSSLLSRPPR